MSRDLELLEGSWVITALEMDGRAMPAGTFEHVRLVINGDRFTSLGMGSVYQGELALDTSTSPRQLDMKFDAGPEKGNTNLGIYELLGDTLKICIATRGTVRPAKFASTPDSGFAVETLTRADDSPTTQPRARASEKIPSSTGLETKFEGVWQMVSGNMDGQPMEASAVQWIRRVTLGQRTKVYAGHQVMMEIEFKDDASKSPGAIDYLHIAGANTGKTQFGIYEFEGNLLTICVAAPGRPRPAQFQVAPSSGGMLTVWKRS